MLQHPFFGLVTAAQDLSADELAIYDAVATSFRTLYNGAFLSRLVHGVVQALKGKLGAIGPSRTGKEVQATVRLEVKTVLNRRGVRKEDLEPFLTSIWEQATALYAE